MANGKQNFFHPKHPVKGDSLVDGFAASNYLEHEQQGVGALKVIYTDIPGNPHAPVALLLHGYRGQPDGSNNKIIADILQRQGIATAQIGFAGIDSYAQKFAAATIDEGTIDTHVADVQNIIAAIPDDRDVILVANSASINVAVPAATSRVSHILAISPAPNITTLLQRGISAFGLQMPEGGHLIHPKDPKVKVTDKFLRAGQPIDLLSADSLSKVEVQPTLITVRSEDDAALSIYGAADFVPTWLELSQMSGYSVFDNPHTGSEHAVDRDAKTSISEQVERIARDLGVLDL